MNKDRIIKDKLSLVIWAKSLMCISDEIWLKPFRKGSWGIADVISHLTSWDHFLVENRIAYILKDEDFPELKVDVEAINKEASLYARSGISKEE